jgi:hypothetical protein
MSYETAAALDLSAPRPARRGSKRTFLRHFGEMLIAMFLGMGLLALAGVAVTAAGGPDFAGQGDASGVILMGISMTVPMVLWMRHRGHNWARSGEMAASMLVPTVVFAALSAVGALGADAVMALEHAVMIPAMLGVMVWRYEEYASPHS